MSDVSQGPGWWQASDGKWYPPTARPGTAPQAPVSAPQPWQQPGQQAWGPPPGYGYPYNPNPYGTGSGLPSVGGLATGSMVLGIIAAIPCCSINHVAALVGLPLGIIALSRIKKGEADPGPRSQAIAGVVLSAIGIAIGVFALAVIIWSNSTTTY